MYFSFLQVVAVVAALSKSMSVTAQCASLGQACGKTSPTGLACCDDLFCGPTVSMSRSLCIQNSTPRLTFAPYTNRSPLVAELIDVLTFMQTFLTPRPES
ncbi:uncharacterized protein HD556DRAFT_1371423 [Suillus plorans]|uniref:Hydrophobin n=1 Tax=Suillus plorans TaxID=116603 RepID=A0A9P7DII5_9AGAM|nr:uncharacterized protein HD556DRAFT_1371423 [Suillus plorans]KAG1794174.1 hypothetical protein HD556DRAFT_1371423 [Suillus plorans]